MALFNWLLSLLVLQLACAHTYYSPLDFLRFEKSIVRFDGSISISVAPLSLPRSGEWVTVVWEGVADPKECDWIGVYSPPVNGSVDIKNHAPVKFQYAKRSPTHLSDGKGSLKFRLVNMRADVIVAFLRGGFEKPELAATSKTVSFANYNEPLQGHLALTGNNTEMILVWVTRDAGTPYVQWGPLHSDVLIKTPATSSQYTRADMCGAPATTVGYRDPGMLHQASLKNLAPGTWYHYKYGDDSYGMSSEAVFMAAPHVAPSSFVRVVAFGDMGNGQPDDSQQVITAQQPALNTTRLISNQLNQTDVVLHIGDISYARGYASVWDEFFDQVAPITARVPYMVCIGNHERDFPDSGSYYTGHDSGGECGVVHERTFVMPRPALDDAWYGFDYGSVHFVLMSTEHDFSPGSKQYQYLQFHLSAVDRTHTPWLVFAGHRPMYIDSTSSEGRAADIPVAGELQHSVEPLLKEYHVDLALWGHHHSYQRTCPLYNATCVEGGTTHVVIGMGGQGLSKNIRKVQPDWIKVVDVEHWGYSRFTANATALVFEFVHDDDGLVHDSFVLRKAAPPGEDQHSL